MTQENFIAEYKAMQAKKQEIEDKMSALKEEYIKSLPFKVGDCVRIKRRTLIIERCWIVGIEMETLWLQPRFNLAINKSKKDGTRSNRKEREYCVDLSEVEMLEEI